MANLLAPGALLLVATGAGGVVSVETGDPRWLVVIGSISTAIVAICGALIVVAPHIGRAITALGSTILPALAAIRKQNEDLNRGTLSAQLEAQSAQIGNLTALLEKSAAEQTKLKHLLEEAAADRAKIAADLAAEQALAKQRIEDINKKLHQAKSDADGAAYRHTEEVEALNGKIAELTAELHATKLELQRAHEAYRLLLGQVKGEVAEVKVVAEANSAAIQELKAGPGQEAGDGGGTAG
jgi:hypothetical protein